LKSILSEVVFSGLYHRTNEADTSDVCHVLYIYNTK